jgi:hypothetical protein
MRTVIVRFPDENSMIEFGKKIGIKHFVRKASSSLRPRVKIKYKKPQQGLDEFFE